MDDTSQLRSFYTAGSRLVYSVDGLRLEAPYDTSPCGGASRWRKTAGACTNPTSLSTATSDKIFSALQNSVDVNPVIRDVYLHNTCADGNAAIGASVDIDGSCWQHVHPDTLNVYDFTGWASVHPGGENYITSIATGGSTTLNFPASHAMSRWSDNKAHHLLLLGRFGDTIDFAQLPPAVLSSSLAAAFGSTASSIGAGFEACGSPGEEANDEAIGNMFGMYLAGKTQDAPDTFNYDLDTPGIIGNPIRNQYQDATVWMEIAVNAADQLRQRIAWALSQIFVVSKESETRYHEKEIFLNFYDILVRNAFGSYRMLLKEIVFSPLMARYLTYMRSTSLAYSMGLYPDENFARELLQLFTIGLWKLNPDGERVADADGDPIATYDSDHVVTYARLWTGFDSQAPRGNIENYDGFELGSRNDIDPMQIIGEKHDPFPKIDLIDGYIGDGYPLCVELPAQEFLRSGASYRYIGAAYTGGSELALGASSALYASLCAPASGQSICTFPSTVTLQTNLACTGVECSTDSLRIVRVDNGTQTGFFARVPRPCTHLAFIASGKAISIKRGPEPWVQCADPRLPIGASLCCHCATCSNQLDGEGRCSFPLEVVTYARNAARCSSAGERMCDALDKRIVSDPQSCNYFDAYLRHWLDYDCTIRAQVNKEGFVSLVHVPWGKASARYPDLRPDNANYFKVRWTNNSYPKVDRGCAPSCASLGSTCLCNVTVAEVAVFTTLPTRALLERSLTIGSVSPEVHDIGIYAVLECSTAACTGSDDVRAYAFQNLRRPF